MMLDIEVSMDGATVMMYIDDGVFSGDYSILKSTDNGYSFTHWRNMPDDVEDINDWVVYDGSTIYCATDGGFYGTSRFGPATKELAGENLVSVALQPDFDPDDVDNMVVTVGNNDGGLFVSTDKGENWGTEFPTGGGGWVTVAFDAMFADNGLLYYCTENSLVGQALVDGNEVDDGDDLTCELLDSEGDDAGADKGYSGLIVAPDNALYVIGYNEDYDPTFTYTASGTIQLAGANQQVDANFVIQVMSDANPDDVSDLSNTTVIDITGIVGGPFIDGEVLNVIGDSLNFEAAGDAITGSVLVQGVTSGATGTFVLAYDGDNPPLTGWVDADTTVSITSASLFADVNTGTITYTNVALAGTGWEDGETLNVVTSAIAGSNIGENADSISWEGDESSAADVIEGDNTGVAESGTFDASETVAVVSSSVVVTETEHSGFTTADSAMYRLLLHEPDNIWEEALLPYAGWYTWYSEGTNIIWNVVDGNMLYAFEDFVSGKVQDATATEVNVSPATATKDVAVSWTHLKGAWEYEIKFTDGMFWYVATPNYDVPAGKTAGDTLTAVVQDLNFATEYDFYVRVAVGEPYMSRWSAEATEVTGWYILPPNPEVPAQGLQGAPLLPSFVWEAAYGAASYDFQLSTSPSFASLLVDINTTDTGYTATTELAYDTNHYWRVRSVAPDGTKSAWCTIQNFHTRTEEQPPVVIPPAETPIVNVTMPAPQVTVVAPDVTVVPPDITVDVPAVVTVTQPPPTTFVLPTDDTGTPVYIWIIVAIGAVLTIAVIVLIIRTRRVV